VAEGWEAPWGQWPWWKPGKVMVGLPSSSVLAEMLSPGRRFHWVAGAHSGQGAHFLVPPVLPWGLTP
jgi:hypothetical protein